MWKAVLGPQIESSSARGLLGVSNVYREHWVVASGLEDVVSDGEQN